MHHHRGSQSSQHTADHWPFGGLADTVTDSLVDPTTSPTNTPATTRHSPIHSLRFGSRRYRARLLSSRGQRPGGINLPTAPPVSSKDHPFEVADGEVESRLDRGRDFTSITVIIFILSF